jgi:hypothetical protein
MSTDTLTNTNHTIQPKNPKTTHGFPLIAYSMFPMTHLLSMSQVATQFRLSDSVCRTRAS